MHWETILFGIFYLDGATYGVMVHTIDANATGMIDKFESTHSSVELVTDSYKLGSCFSCFKNSNTL